MPRIRSVWLPTSGRVSDSHWFLTTCLGEIVQEVFGWTINRKESIVAVCEELHIPHSLRPALLEFG